MTKIVSLGVQISINGKTFSGPSLGHYFGDEGLWVGHYFGRPRLGPVPLGAIQGAQGPSRYHPTSKVRFRGIPKNSSLAFNSFDNSGLPATGIPVDMANFGETACKNWADEAPGLPWCPNFK